MLKQGLPLKGESLFLLHTPKTFRYETTEDDRLQYDPTVVPSPPMKILTARQFRTRFPSLTEPVSVLAPAAGPGQRSETICGYWTPAVKDEHPATSLDRAAYATIGFTPAPKPGPRKR